MLAAILARSGRPSKAVHVVHLHPPKAGVAIVSKGRRREPRCRSTSRVATCRSPTRCASHAERRLGKVARQVSELARLEIEIFKEPNPRVADCQVAEGTLYLKGVTLRAHDASPGDAALAEPDGRRARPPGQAPPRQTAPPPRGPRGRHAGAPRPPPRKGRWPPHPRRGHGGRRGRTRLVRFATPVGSYPWPMPSLLDRALNVGEAKKFKIYQKRVALINAFEPELEHDSDAELRERMDELRERARPPARTSTSCCRSASRSCARPASGRWACATSTSS